MSITDANTAVEEARALVPALRERRGEANDLRRLPDSTVADILRIGVHALAAPREIGGADVGPDGLFEASYELGKGCAATAWCAGNWAIHILLLSAFSPQAQNEALGNGIPLVTTGFSPLRAVSTKVDGGAELNGQWDFASGIDHAEWVLLVAGGPVGLQLYLVRKDELEIIDTWHTSGLRGTGSQDVRAEKLFVPEYRILEMAPVVEGQSQGRELYATPFLRMPLGSVFGPGVIGSLLGAAAGALDVFVERTSEKLGGFTGVKVRTRPEVHHVIGEAASDIEAAVTVVRRNYAEIREFAETGREFNLEDRVRWRRKPAWSARVALGAVNSLFQLGGAHSLWLDDQLHQFQLDVTAASHHYGLQWDGLFTAHGLIKLGEEPTVLMV